MDFAAGELDDVDVVSPEQIRTVLSQVRDALERLERSYAQGHRLREGASLALVGRPNVGKSSLFNRLLERERAIVTPLPGTTRDTVEEATAVGGIPLRLIDTAGLRLSGESPADEAEALGIARSREALADADLVVVVLDATAVVAEEETELLRSLDGRPLRRRPEQVGPGTQRRRIRGEDESDSLLTSALTGEGIEASAGDDPSPAARRGRRSHRRCPELAPPAAGGRRRHWIHWRPQRPRTRTEFRMSFCSPTCTEPCGRWTASPAKPPRTTS